MTESVFERFEDGWHDWFRHATRHNTAVTSVGDSMLPGDLQAPPAIGAPVSLKAIVDDVKTAAESAEVNIRTVLDQHMPGLIALAERVENDPLIQAAEAAALPAGAKQIVADFITKLAESFPQPAALVEAAPEPAAA